VNATMSNASMAMAGMVFPLINIILLLHFVDI